MKIAFSHIGKSLGTRFLANKIRMQVETGMANKQFVTFDLTGVESMSHSFADECFGKLLLTHDLNSIKSNSTFIGAKKEVEQVILFTIKERFNKLHQAEA